MTSVSVRRLTMTAIRHGSGRLAAALAWKNIHHEGGWTGATQICVGAEQAAPASAQVAERDSHQRDHPDAERGQEPATPFSVTALWNFHITPQPKKER
jgi:hypothetical protein